jgi:Uma2 family endonuclease
MQSSEPTEPKRPATYADIENAPDDKIAEIIDEELVLSPRPRSTHAFVASTLGIELGGPFQRGRGGPGGLWILDEVELHLGRDIIVPDLVGWRRDRMPSIPDVVGIKLPPDWVCEVLSPSTEAKDRTRKLPIYQREGVSFVWFINPALRTLEVLKLESGRWVLLGSYLGDEKVRAAPFEALELELSALWSE